jgi:hypothetical protein
LFDGEIMAAPTRRNHAFPPSQRRLAVAAIALSLSVDNLDFSFVFNDLPPEQVCGHAGLWLWSAREQEYFSGRPRSILGHGRGAARRTVRSARSRLSYSSLIFLI